MFLSGNLKILDALEELTYVKQLEKGRVSKHFKQPPNAVNSADTKIENIIQYVPRETNTDFRPGSHENDLFENYLKTDSKRGWEDVPFSWRRINPKRALEVVHRLWNSPEIRRQYIHYLRNGKRSKELMEEIPVQSDNLDPTWMIDEVGYYPDEYLSSLDGKSYGHELSDQEESFQKRGWEDIAFLGKRRFPEADLGSSFVNADKRGWEAINLKRTFENDTTPKGTLRKLLAGLSNKIYSQTNGQLDSEINNTNTKLFRNAYDNIVAKVASQDNSSWWQNVLNTDM